MKWKNLLVVIPFAFAPLAVRATDAGDGADRGNPRDVRVIDQTNVQYGQRALPGPDSTQARSDEDTAAAIHREIAEDQSLATNVQDINVVVNNGVVQLSGTLATEFDKDAVQRIAARVAGEQNVQNDISVSANAH